MTRPPDRHEDDRLQALFDRTAQEPTGTQLTKLSAHAAAVPQGASARWWLPLGILAPALAAAAAVGLLFVWPDGTPQRDGSNPGRSLATVATLGTSSAMTEQFASEDGPSDLPTYEDVFPGGATAMFSYGADDFDPLGGSLDEPDSEADLDAWLAATEEILGDG